MLQPDKSAALLGDVEPPAVPAAEILTSGTALVPGLHEKEVGDPYRSVQCPACGSAHAVHPETGEGAWRGCGGMVRKTPLAGKRAGLKSEVGR
jgi:hypothetical protein